MRSIKELESLAPNYLAAYCDARQGFAWPAYDVDHLPGLLVPTDLLAPAFLSYPIKGTYLNEMFRADAPNNPYAVLLRTLETAATTHELQALRFEELPLDALARRESRGWGLVLECLDAVQECVGLTSVAVTKILHRKLPSLVPVNDSRIRAFYGVAAGYSTLFERLHADLNQHLEMIDALRSPYQAPDGRRMSRLRALDIAIWMHMADDSSDEADTAPST